MKVSIFENHLYERNFFEHELPSLAQEVPDADAVLSRLKELCSRIPQCGNETQLEDEVIVPVLRLLGWPLLRRQRITVQGKQMEPDWTLFKDEASLQAFRNAADEQKPSDGIVSFLESKHRDKLLDTGKADRKHNPYFQLLEYLNFARLPLGFLSNGHEWWLVDNRQVSANKRFVRVHLDRLTEAGDIASLRLFFHLFGRASHIRQEQAERSGFEDAARVERLRREASEDDLRKVIYGIDGRASLFEKVGQALYAVASDKAQESLCRIFGNALYFTFRLLFIAYFEDRHWDILKAHSNYPRLSLRKLYQDLPRDDPRDYTGWDSLQTLFDTLNRGKPNFAIPLLNGGLFDDERAPLLALPRIMDNDQLRQVLDLLFIIADTGGRLRDFRTLSVTHLGTIYEGLLGFEFRIAEENLVYLEYQRKGGKGAPADHLDGYFDAYDAARIRADAKCLVRTSIDLPRGCLYLVSSRNSRKTTASYYTPSELSLPLVRRAIDHALARLEPEKSILDLRILDNACGSGHLLVECLSYLTRCALERLAAADDDARPDPRLAEVLATEKARIEEVLRGMGFSGALAEADELAVLKRILLKRAIYGVDVQPFAIELAHLSLWIETFIFGTPLSFIEHHVKSGNALIGTTRGRFTTYLDRTGQQQNLLTDEISETFARLNQVFHSLNRVQDTTAEDVERSKRIFRDEVRPALERMNLLLDTLNTIDMMMVEGDVEYEAARKTGDKKAQTAARQKRDGAEALRKKLVRISRPLLDGAEPELRATLEAYRQRYQFFNWGVEFPEAFAMPTREERGFHVIVGNPPWDKTKFADPDFFSQYRSNYRSLSNSAKKTLQTDLLAKPYIARRYRAESKRALVVNAYYKSRYPLNAGEGDGNLFRFFVERNLRLLTVGGSLNYVLPTALLTDDGSTELRKHILQHCRLLAFDGFENRKKLFPDVDTRYKFGLLQVENTPPEDEAAPMRCRFMLTSPATLTDSGTAFEYTLADIRATSPRHWAFMEVAHGRKDLEILARSYGRFSALDPEWLDFRRELDATNDKRIFHEKRKPHFLPLCKGACIWQYDSRFAEPEYWLDPEEFDAFLRNKEISRLIDDVYPQLTPNNKKSKEQNVLSALGLHQRAELAAFITPDRAYYRLGFRDIARDTDERTLIATVLPKDIGAQHTMWLCTPKRYVLDADSRRVTARSVSIQRIFYAQALFNSVCIDWLIRFSASIHVTKSVLMRVPMPQPTDEELRGNPVYMEMTRNSLLLSCHYNREKFIPLLADCGLTEADVPTTAKQTDMLKIRNDVLAAGLYGIESADMEHMLKSFAVLRNKKPGYVAALLAAMQS